MKTHSKPRQRCHRAGRARHRPPVEFLALAKEVARWHHERWDGRGYPDGLIGRRDPDLGAPHDTGRRLRRPDFQAGLQGRDAFPGSAGNHHRRARQASSTPMSPTPSSRPSMNSPRSPSSYQRQGSHETPEPTHNSRSPYARHPERGARLRRVRRAVYIVFRPDRPGSAARRSRHSIVIASTLKGWAVVVITALLLYYACCAAAARSRIAVADA
jgi:hypothetical protein